MPFLRNRRKLATFFYRKRLPLLEALNKNVLYNEVLESTFREAKAFDDRFDLYEYLNRSILQEAPVNYLEFGVWEGASIRKWCELNRCEQSRFYGFDSFEGLPENWNATHSRGCFDVGGRLPAITDFRAKFVKGLFQKTLVDFLKDFRNDRRLVVHIDCDLYSSALYCLANLHPYLVPDSIVIFDEFRELEDEFSAFCDYTRAFYRRWEGLTHTAIYSNVAMMVKE